MAVAATLAGCTEAVLCPFERIQTVLQDKKFHGKYKWEINRHCSSFIPLWKLTYKLTTAQCDYASCICCVIFLDSEFYIEVDIQNHLCITGTVCTSAKSCGSMGWENTTEEWWPFSSVTDQVTFSSLVFAHRWRMLYQTRRNCGGDTSSQTLSREHFLVPSFRP